MIILIKGIPRCSASGWNNNKCVIARLDRAIQCLGLDPPVKPEDDECCLLIIDTSQLAPGLFIHPD